MESSIKPVIYKINFIKELGKIITTILSDDIINNLLEIKSNNKFIKRRSPIRLKYTMSKSVADTWRKQKEQLSISEKETFIENLNSILNKLSNNNYNVISKQFEKLIESNKMYEQEFLTTFFNKCINEKNFITLYVRLLNIYIEIFNIKSPILFINIINEYYNKNIYKEYDFDLNDNNYDNLCLFNKNKSKILGCINLIAKLYINNIILKDELLRHYNGLIEHIFKESVPYYVIDTNIECICMLIRTSCPKFNDEFKDTFDTIIMSHLYKIKDNTDKFKSRTRFLIMDLIELKDNNWIKT